MKPILLFDWGNTIMVDFELEGPMYTWEKVAWVEGAKEAIEILSRSHDLYLATNAGASDTSGVEKALKRVGADRFFKRIFLAAEVGYGKPDRRYFQFIIDQLGVPSKSLVMIGDHYEKDVVGAVNAGIQAVFYNRKHEKGNFSMASAVILNMNELPGVIDKL